MKFKKINLPKGLVCYVEYGDVKAEAYLRKLTAPGKMPEGFDKIFNNLK